MLPWYFPKFGDFCIDQGSELNWIELDIQIGQTSLDFERDIFGGQNTRAQIGNREVMRQVRRALARVGYRVEISPPDGGPSGRVLSCRVDRFRFNNYTWLAPIIPIWGSIALTLSVEGPDRHVYWTQSFEGDGFTFNFFDGFTSAANASMEEILDPMVAAFASEEFLQAVTEP